MIAPVLVATLVRMSGVLAVGLIVALTLRRRSAALRHWVLALSVYGALAVPGLTLVLPSWAVPRSVPFGPSATVPTGADVDVELVGPVAGSRGRAMVPANDEDQDSDRAPVGRPPIEFWLVTLWLAGVAIVSAVPVVGVIRLLAVQRDARVVRDGPWASGLERLADADPRLRRTVLMQSDHPSWPLTWGVRRPTIVLPRGAADWTDARIQVVLHHEAAHIRRGDWVTQLAAELLCALCWCTPFAWLTRARLQADAERACDDAVLTAGAHPPDYAAHLVDLARALGQPRVGLAAPAMARPSSLEGRVTAMLNPALVRTPTSRPTQWLVAIVGLGLTASISSVAAQPSFATFSGTVRDQLGGTVPNVTLTVTHGASGAKHEVRTTDRGTFEFVGLVPGNYALDVRAPGFKTIADSLQLAGGQTMRRDVALPVGSLRRPSASTGFPARRHHRVRWRRQRSVRPGRTVVTSPRPARWRTCDRAIPPR